MTRNGTVDRIESAANITLLISRGTETGVTNSDGSSGGDDNATGYIEIPISRLDTTKEVEISEIRESTLKASGYAITSISYSGTMMFKGSHVTKEVPDQSNGALDGDTIKKSVNNFLYDDVGVPQPHTISINHDLDNEAERYQHVLTTSESYEVRNEQETEQAYDWVAMDRRSDQPRDDS